MEKQIGRYSYWLGIACLVIAVVWRILNAFGLWLPVNVTPGHTVWYLSFFHGSILFFVATIATTCFTWLNSKQP